MKEYDKVKVISTGATGIVVDIRHTTGTYFLVELDESNELVDCTEDELEVL